MQNTSAQKVVTEFPASKPKRKGQVAIKVQHKRSAQQCIAAIAAGFLPVASYVIAHVEAKEQPYLYFLVAAALGYSAPTLATWAKRWCGNIWKAASFTILLECTSVFSHIQALNLTGLFILVLINSCSAWDKSKNYK